MKIALLLSLVIGLPDMARAQFGTARPSGDKFPVKHSNSRAAGFGGGAVLGGSDDCSTPVSINGQGVFPYDNTGATTGTQGQAECSGTINNDEWFNWTANATGIATIRTCNQTSIDTELAAYPAGGCPADGSSLACNDDACGLQSSISFPVTSGTTYLVQAGSFALGSTGPSALEITIVPPVTNDDCANPVIISGQGSFSFDTTMATIGAEGQNEANCNAFGNTGVDHDVWFTWIADADGRAVVQTCAGAVNDTKIAAYPGAGCPANGASLACNDDSCGVQSSICFDVINGGVYTLQIGTFPGSPGGTGTFGVSIASALSGYRYDSGASTNNFGGPGGAILWGQFFDADGGADLITKVSTTYGTPLYPGLLSGRNAQVLIYDDPNNDYDASDATLLYSAAVLTANEDTDIFNDYVIPNVPVSGVFIVAIVAEYDSGQFPAPMDESCPANRSFFSANTPSFGGYGNFDINNLNNNEYPATDMAGFGFPTNWLLRAEGTDHGCMFGAGVPAFLEKNKVHVINMRVYSSDGQPLAGVQIRVNGNPVAGVTNAQGFIDVPVTMGEEGTQAVITAHRPLGGGGFGQECATKTIIAAKRKCNGDLDVTVNIILVPGAAFHFSDADVTGNASFELDSGACPVPLPTVLAFTGTVLDEVAPGVFWADIDSYSASYPGFTSCGVTVGPTTDSLIPRYARYLVIDSIAGTINGYFSSMIQNDYLGVATAHNEVFGSYSGGIATIQVVGVPSVEQIGTKYCVATDNSTGAPADISASGSASSAAGNLTLTSAPVPNQNCIFFHGTNQSQSAFGNGWLCTSGGLVRGIVVSASGNQATYTYDNSNAKHSLSSFIAQNRNFQHWFRDPMAGGALFNTSNAISIAIQP